MKVVPFPMCPCVETGHDSMMILPTFYRHARPSGIESTDTAIPNSNPGETIWNSGCLTEDHQIRKGSTNPSVMANDKKIKMKTSEFPLILTTSNQKSISNTLIIKVKTFEFPLILTSNVPEIQIKHNNY